MVHRNMKLWAKILLTILTTAAIIFGGFIIMIIVTFGVGENFYAAITVICAAVIWLYAVTQIWGPLKRKIKYISFGASAGLILLSVAGFEIHKAYVRSIDEVNEQGINLIQYEPFEENTKAVSLNEQSTLKITENLPKLDGATALYPLYSAFARAVYPEGYYMSDVDKNDKEYVVCTNTDGAYKRLITGAADIIFVAGPSREQLQMAKDNGVELTLTPIGREAFVFFVNSKNPVDGLSISDIQKIYSGEAKSWKEFGGKNIDIKAFQRPVNSGSQTALIKIMGDTPIMKPLGEDVIDPMGGMFTRVSSYKNYNSAIGYSFLFFATEMVNDNKIKLLSINGIAPTRENVANGTYPYSSEFYAITAGTENPNVGKLIEWIQSEQGQYLVEKTGYTRVAWDGSSHSEGPASMNDAKKTEYIKITSDEAVAMMYEDGVIVLDVRTQEEFDAGHIKNAVLLPDYEINDKADMTLPDKDETILVYCRTGRRSEAAAKLLSDLGYSNVFDFGGIVDWTGEIEK